MPGSSEETISILEGRLTEQSNNFGEISRVGALMTSFLERDHILPSIMESALATVRAEVGQMVIFGEDQDIQTNVCWGPSRPVSSSIVSPFSPDKGYFFIRTGLMNA